MIFSLSEKPSALINFEIPQTDIFCFFHSESAIKVPSQMWLHAIASSLKMKKNVLILEAPIAEIPVINSSQRWHASNDYLWLAPRSLSVLLEAPQSISATYPTMKAHLTTFK